MHSDDFMNAEDVARYLHLGKNTVYQLAKSGKLASYHVGRKLKFTLEDVEAYVASTHRSPGARTIADQIRHDPEVSKAPSQSMSEAASFGELQGTRMVLAGGDTIADLIASTLNSVGMPTSRLLNGSYTSLVNLYAGEADAAVVHLYDQRTNSYNVPYARSLAPGVSVVIMRLYGREQGFIVKEGNPKKLTTWGALLREGVRISNRAKGSGSRVLLDEKLRAMEARSESIAGYDTTSPVASAAIRRVAGGLADVAIGTEREAQRTEGVEFVPLQMEWVDIVVAKKAESRPFVRSLSTLLSSEGFQRAAGTLAPCDLSKLGSVIYES